jgi:serine/threonine-protein kinase RsbW
MCNNQHDGSFFHSSDRTCSSWSFQEERLHTISEIQSVLKALGADMVRWGFHYTEVFSVRRAIGEALRNAIRHGHRGDSSKTVQLNYLICADYVLAEVIDEGPGFDTQKIAASFSPGRPGGKGLYFMRLFLDWIRFDGRGNRVTLCKMRSFAQQPGDAHPPGVHSTELTL